jgi:hypothetical protein
LVALGRVLGLCKSSQGQAPQQPGSLAFLRTSARNSQAASVPSMDFHLHHKQSLPPFLASTLAARISGYVLPGQLR